MRDQMTLFSARMAQREPLLCDGSGLHNGPGHWPQVTVAVSRLVKNGQHIAVARVRRLDPYTGGVIELSWSGAGTSLRGARMQRHRDEPRWALWNNDGRANDPHLDSP